MTVSVAQFRADFPEFGSTDIFPASQVTFWLNLASLLINPNRWGKVLDAGTELFVAHNLAIEARAQAEAAGGGIPGGQVGPMNSKSVDKVSIGYDTSAGIEAGAGHWNLTTYGTRFIRLAKMFGAGPVQIGVGVVPNGNGLAWPGPLTTPGFTNFGG
jgi:hypothetical protein